jgi:hypothetical protein
MDDVNLSVDENKRGADFIKKLVFTGKDIHEAFHIVMWMIYQYSVRRRYSGSVRVARSQASLGGFHCPLRTSSI